MLKRLSPRERFEQLVSTCEPLLRIAFIEAIDDIRSNIVLRRVVERMERGDINGAVAASRTSSIVRADLGTLDQPAREGEARGSLVFKRYGVTRSASANPFDVVQTIASKTGGQAKYLPVPFIADSEDDREVFIQQRVVQDIIRTAMRARACFLSVGECDASSFLSRYGYMSSEDLPTLSELGAVGDTLGLFFDANGNYIDTQLCRRTLAINLADLSHSDIILLSAGKAKVNATRAILKARFINGLIIYAESAKKLMAGAEL